MASLGETEREGKYTHTPDDTETGGAEHGSHGTKNVRGVDASLNAHRLDRLSLARSADILQVIFCICGA